MWYIFEQLATLSNVALESLIDSSELVNPKWLFTSYVALECLIHTNELVLSLSIWKVWIIQQNWFFPSYAFVAIGKFYSF